MLFLSICRFPLQHGFGFVCFSSRNNCGECVEICIRRIEEWLNKSLWLTQFVNHLVRRFVCPASALHLQPSNPELPIPNTWSWHRVLLVGTTLARVLRSRLSVKSQVRCTSAEMLLTTLGFGIKDLLEENFITAQASWFPSLAPFLFVLLSESPWCVPAVF